MQNRPLQVGGTRSPLAGKQGQGRAAQPAGRGRGHAAGKRAARRAAALRRPSRRGGWRLLRGSRLPGRTQGRGPACAASRAGGARGRHGATGVTAASAPPHSLARVWQWERSRGLRRRWARGRGAAAAGRDGAVRARRPKNETTAAAGGRGTGEPRAAAPQRRGSQLRVTAGRGAAGSALSCDSPGSKGRAKECGRVGAAAGSLRVAPKTLAGVTSV
jgi:hypothetical protein